MICIASTNRYIRIRWYQFASTNCIIPIRIIATFRHGVGIDAMVSKSKKNTIVKNKRTPPPKHTEDDPRARRCVSQRAPSREKTCPMRLLVYLSNQNEWYLQTNSCLQHKFHPKLDNSAMVLSQKDMSEQEQSLVNVLYDYNVPPSTISRVLSSLSDEDKGSFNPRFLFNFNEKSRNLIDVANGILPTCSDAEKTLKKLEL